MGLPPNPGLRDRVHPISIPKVIRNFFLFCAISTYVRDDKIIHQRLSAAIGFGEARVDPGAFLDQQPISLMTIRVWLFLIKAKRLFPWLPLGLP
jgi:hypothetical protein